MNLDPELLRRLLLFQSFFDRTTMLAREFDEKRLPTQMFAERVSDMSKQFDSLLKGKGESAA